MAKKKGKNGRPLKYKKEYDNIAYVSCRDGGLTDPSLAAMFKVDRSCINAWKNDHPSFKKALVKGKDEHDSLLAEKFLLKRVKGFKYTETTQKPVKVDVVDEDGNKTGETEMIMKVVKKVKKQVIPSVKAMKYWLKNRNSDRWRDKFGLEFDDLTVKVRKKEFTGEDLPDNVLKEIIDD